MPVSSVVAPVLTSLVVALTGAFDSAQFNPAVLFGNGEPGAFLDANDWGPTGTGGTGVVFQDLSGTAVTAMEQPVQLILDKSQGLKLGSNVVTNGDFSNGLAGWTTTGTTAPATVTVNGSNQLELYSTGATYARANQGIPTVAGVWYKLTFDALSVVGSYMAVWVGSTIGTNDLGYATFATAGSKAVYFRATGTTTYIRFENGYNGICAVDNVTSRSIAGNHAYVSASANRPVISARYNLLTKTEDFSVSPWITAALLSINTSAGIAPNGTNTANLVIPDTSVSTHQDSQPFTPTAGVVYKSIIRAKQSGYSWLLIQQSFGGINCYQTYNLSNGTLGTTTGGGGTATITQDAQGFWNCALTGTATASAAAGRLYIWILNADSITGYAGNGTSGVYLWGADLRPSDQATGLIPTYQRVNTATDYDWSPAFPPMIKGNGSNQYLGTNSIDLTGTSKVTAWVGSRKLSDAALGLLFEHGDVNTGSVRAFTLNAPRTAGVPGYALQIRDATNSVETKVTTGYPAPVTNVITSQLDYSGATIAAQALLRFNGQNVANTVSGTLVSGAFGNYPLNIFWRPSAGLYFNGGFNSLIILGAAATAAQISTTENWCNLKLRAY